MRAWQTRAAPRAHGPKRGAQRAARSGPATFTRSGRASDEGRVWRGREDGKAGTRPRGLWRAGCRSRDDARGARRQTRQEAAAADALTAKRRAPPHK
ncbi:MAG: hypothetical protein LAN61_10490 [Acidobacteriia bacterium]|nr:hypothetical protein [Terriglobia bacterium]